MKGNGPNINELTRIEAFLLSEKAGHPSHMNDYFWAQAEAIVRQRVAIVDVAVRANGTKSAKIGKPVKAKPAVVKAKKTAELELSLHAEFAAKPKKPATGKKAAPVTRKAATKAK